MIHGAPQVVPFSIYLHEHLLQVPTANASKLEAAKPVFFGFQRQTTDQTGSTRDGWFRGSLRSRAHATVLSHFIATAKPDIQHHRKADDIAARLKVAEKGELSHGGTLKQVAARVGKTERYIRRITPLAFLSPGIQTAILDGTQPVELTLEPLVRSFLPLDWSAQENPTPQRT